MPTRNQVDATIDALITPDGADKVTASEHREANAHILNYVDQQDTAVAATVTALTTSTATALAAKQATLVSATNIKTVNGTSLLGAGDIAIAGSDLTASEFADLLEDGVSDAGNIAPTRVGDLIRFDLAWNGVWTDPEAIPDVDGATLTQGRANETYAPIGLLVTLVGTAWNIGTSPLVEQAISATTAYTLTGGTNGVTRGLLIINKTGTGTVTINGDEYPTKDNGTTAISVVKMLSGTYHISSDYADGTVLTTPAAPTTFVTDDTLDTGGWTDQGGKTYADAEISFTGGSSYVAANGNPHSGITGAYGIGVVKVRYAAVPGVSNASLPLANTVAFTSALPSLAAPTFVASDISDTEIDLTSITADVAATNMLIERATNAGMSTGLTTVHTGAIVTSFNDTGLTASTTYYYRITVSETGYNDGVSSVMSDTTQASGGGAFPVSENFDAVANGSIPTGYTADAGVAVATTLNVSSPKSLQFPVSVTSQIVYNTIASSADGYIQNDSRIDEAGYFEDNLYIRATNAAIDASSNAYMLNWVPGSGLRLYKKVAAAYTQLTTPVGGGSVTTGQFYRIRLTVTGNVITASLQRLSDSLWMDNGGLFQVGATDFASYTDSSSPITAAGYFGKQVNNVAATGTPANYTDNLELA